MKRSTDRILTTHVGSLPRPADLLDMMQAKEAGRGFDEASYGKRLRSAVGEIVQKQAELGIDVVDDDGHARAAGNDDIEAAAGKRRRGQSDQKGGERESAHGRIPVYPTLNLSDRHAERVKARSSISGKPNVQGSIAAQMPQAALAKR